jgi:signal transduction histidine kinase
MRKLLPKSLAGQMALLIGIALLLAQLASFAYLLVERQQFSRAEIETPAITRFTSVVADYAQAAPDFQPLVLSDASRRGARYEAAANTAVGPGLVRRANTETQLRQSLESAEIAPREVRAAIDPTPFARRGGPDGRRRNSQTLILSAQLVSGRWVNGRQSIPAPPALVTPDIVVGTLLLYLFVLGAALFIGARIARPLRDLTRAAEAFQGRNEPAVVEPSGPSDLRRAISAFNAMNERVVTLLEEKDRTLGAIGHDLRTPLASLRIRAESVEPEGERDRMIRTIEEMTATLDDILVLARSGRAREPVERVDVTVLVSEIVAEYRERGEVLDFSGPEDCFAQIHSNLVRRAVRNLIDNALKYGKDVAVDVIGDAQSVAVAVLDRGPGLPDAELGRISGAFYRAEPSRNRETGGAGLGLAIAQSIVDAHGGELRLANREGGGFAATIVLPRAQ